jgi:hypothetical protein
MLRNVCLSTFLVLFVQNAAAQVNANQYGSEVSGYVGTLLPNQISGVTEILPHWGLRYSHPLSFGFVEAGVRDSHAKGILWDVVSLDLRFDMNTVEGFTNIFYIGADMNAYKPEFRGDRIWTGGAHFGSGLLMKVASTFWIRTDIGLAVSPGTSLFLNLGFAIRTPAGGG